VASRFREEVWALVRTVPPGRVTTYGDIAEAYYGTRKGAQSVGQAVARSPDGVPWWRVVQFDGGIIERPCAAEQRARLREEGVPVVGGRVVWDEAGGPFSPPQRRA
jgi:methylated-DNA-protein-cysteine methyltransferase-like protein